MTHCRRVLLEKLTVTELIKDAQALYGKERFISANC
jgi:hypothetical protein